MIKGQCYCGNIHYQAKNVLKMAICHCRSCRKLTGGTAWGFLVVLEDEIKISGETKTFSRQGESGKDVLMHFCSLCGSTVFGQPQLCPQIRTISSSSLDDEELFKPDCHVWTKDAPSWTSFIPGAQKFEKNPS
jgi:hypothetical protein